MAVWSTTWSWLCSCLFLCSCPHATQSPWPCPFNHVPMTMHPCPCFDDLVSMTASPWPCPRACIPSPCSYVHICIHVCVDVQLYMNILTISTVHVMYMYVVLFMYTYLSLFCYANSLKLNNKGLFISFEFTSTEFVSKKILSRPLLLWLLGEYWFRLSRYVYFFSSAGVGISDSINPTSLDPEDFIPSNPNPPDLDLGPTSPATIHTTIQNFTA